MNIRVEQRIIPAIDVFVVDPPWPKKKGGLRSARPRQGKALDYATLDVTAIFELLDKRGAPNGK